MPDPVFVDRTGRRRRLFALAGAAGGLLLALVALALIAGLTGTGPAVIPGLPAAERAERPKPAPTRTAPLPIAPAPAGLSLPRPPTTSPAPATAGPASLSPSPAGNSHRRVPTQTPSHKAKKP